LLKYVSFQYTMSEVRMRYLYTNNCINVKARFEILYNINTKVIVTDKENER